MTPGRPWHLWLIGILGGLWSGMGAVSFILTQMNAEAVMSRFPPRQRDYFLSFPWWADGFWALGVFAGVIGCLLLLLRNRLAAPVLIVSLIGAVVANLGGLLLAWRDGGDARNGRVGFHRRSHHHWRLAGLLRSGDEPEGPAPGTSALSRRSHGAAWVRRQVPRLTREGAGTSRGL